MAAPIPDELDDIGRDIYARLGTIYEGQGTTKKPSYLYQDKFARFNASFIQALDAFRAQLKSQL